MKYTLAVFDMDGTILDTLEDLCDSTNYALNYCGLPVCTLTQVRSYVGNGIKKLIERAVPQGTDKATTDKVFCIFKQYYREHCSEKTKPYDGIKELLTELKANGYLTAVVSNKADFAVQQLCVEYFTGLFDVAVGERDGLRKKPAPDSVEEVLKELSVKKENAVYIGDSEVDIETALNCSMKCITVLWGFRDKDLLIKHGAEKFVSSTEELAKELLNI